VCMYVYMYAWCLLDTVVSIARDLANKAEAALPKLAPWLSDKTNLALAMSAALPDADLAQVDAETAKTLLRDTAQGTYILSAPCVTPNPIFIHFYDATGFRSMSIDKLIGKDILQLKTALPVTSHHLTTKRSCSPSPTL